jgi:hypothetical protein
MRQPNFQAPFLFEDQRVYDVLELRIMRSPRPRIRCYCSIEVQSRRDQTYMEFLFFFRANRQSGGELSERRGPEALGAEEAQHVLTFCRRWVWRYLNTHTKPPAPAREVKPIIVYIRLPARLPENGTAAGVEVNGDK